MPSSSPIECLLITTVNTQTNLRTNLLRTQLENLTYTLIIHLQAHAPILGDI
jgi:hypothetical protein